MKINKFLNQYPQLWEPKIGDRVRIIKIIDGAFSEHKSWPHYNINDTGTIVEYGTYMGHTTYRIYFDNPIHRIKNLYVFREEIKLRHE